MSSYDNRTEPGYSNHTVSEYANNEHILKWWLPEYDALLKKEIDTWEWTWPWASGIYNIIVKVAPEEALDKWRSEDPLCQQYAWYNILTGFAIARAKNIGLLDNIREAKLKNCFLCNELFREDSLPTPLTKRLGMDKLNYCSPCLVKIVFQDTGNKSSSEDEIKEYLLLLSNLIGKVPTQGFGEGMNDLIGIDIKDIDNVVSLLHQKKPSTNRVIEVFGSWLNALIQAGILENGTRKTARGIQTIAKDGHMCFSLGEKTIDDFLYSHGILHTREPRYPESNYRGDFKVGDVFIEFFGLSGNFEYDAKTQEKIQLCKTHKIQLIAIYPQDLINLKKLENKLACLK